MKRQQRDLVSLFNALWYRDFPVTPVHMHLGRRAVWTTHIASIIKRSADYMGYFTCFETGGRTDAVIQTADGREWARIEWEWAQPRLEKVNEIGKLSDATQGASDLAVFVGYSDTRYHDDNIQSILEQWRSSGTLIAFIVEFELKGRTRRFTKLRSYVFKDGACKALRQQEALPWNVPGSRWQLLAQGAPSEQSGASELGDGDL